jgi:predicted O-methyltransferase YrrM
MPIIAHLASLYESRGIKISSGLNPSLFSDFPMAPFTWFFKNGQSMTEGLGIALQEIYFLECLFAQFQPQRLFAIGNSLGWSTLALGLLNPTARVLAIDAGLDRNARDGIEFTNRVAAEENLPVAVVAGRSPADVSDILLAAEMVPVDFAFVDGYHSVEQVKLDFDAVRAHAAPGCVYLFHDVAMFALHPGIERITRESGLAAQMLPGTTSGMALVYDPAQPPAALQDIAPFAASPEAVAMIGQAAWRHRHRHLARWCNSLAKRFGRRRDEPARLGETASGQAC